MCEYKKGKGIGHGQPARAHLRERHSVRRVLLPDKAQRLLARFRSRSAAHHSSNRRHYRHYIARLQMEK